MKRELTLDEFNLAREAFSRGDVDSARKVIESAGLEWIDDRVDKSKRLMSDVAKKPEAVDTAVGVPAPEQPKSGADAVSRANPEEALRREIRAEVKVGEKERTIDLSFASEIPVKRYDWRKDKEFNEVLSCKPEDVDLSRLNNSHPLLLNHDTYNQIGVVEKARVDADGKCRATVRFSKSQVGEEIWNDVKDGIRRLVSVGYKRIKEVATEVKGGVETVRFSWQPYEVSIVSVPADATVGIGRNQELPKSQNKKEKITMSEKVEVVSEAPKRDYVKDNAEIIAISKNLANKVDGIRDLQDKAIAEGWPVDKFRAEALNKLPEAKPVQTSPLADVKARDWKHYSISRAICMQTNGGKRDGFESEMDQELALKNGKRASGMWIPDEAFARSHVAGTATLGGFLVQNTVASNELIEILRNKSQVLNLGARVISLDGPTFIPRHNGSGTSNWVAETTASTLTAVNFTNMTLTPKCVTGFQQYSKQLLMTGNPSIDGLLRDDMTQSLATAIDLAALHGAGTAEPVGIAGTSGIGSVAAAASGIALATLAATNYAALVSLETLVAAGNADMGALAYLARPAHRGALKGVSRFASTDTPVWDGGTVNGYRAEVTNQIATNLTTGTATTITSMIFFGNWNELLIANFGSTDLVVDELTAAANRVVRLYAHRYVDMGVRHPASFAVLGGILA